MTSENVKFKISLLNQVWLGPGLRRIADDVFVSRAGVLKKTHNNIYYVDGLQKRYVPAPDEMVVGIVTKKLGDFFRVDIGASEQALVHFQAFKGATKKMRPNINVGDILFGKVVLACPDMEPELVCCEDTQGEHERLGILPPTQGHLFTCSLHLVRKLVSPDCKLFDILKKAFKFETAIGMNGKVWVNGVDVTTTIALGDAILSAEIMTNKEIEEHCNKLAMNVHFIK
ncbi:hypothetical protein AAG570_010011 [Ranatra chinensis]|uniref:Ribosomal RNA-processing protein 40 n=1 Tax=Ranatra chinensis TaxID=642074 RepID=A0ABD0Z7I3_9HEMI